MTQLRSKIRFQKFCWRTSNGKMIPIENFSNDRLTKNYISIKERFDKGAATIKTLSGKQKVKESERQINREIVMLAVEQELDKRNILIT